MKISRDDIVDQLRGMGRNEEADRAMKELPKKVDVDKYAGVLHGYGFDMPTVTGKRVWDLPSW